MASDDARTMLTRLQGRTHCVCTAVAVRMPGGEQRDFAEISRVTFRPMSPQDIDHYLVEVPVLDKAGAYAMQEKSELIVESVQGDVDNVIGLPVAAQSKALRSVCCGRFFPEKPIFCLRLKNRVPNFLGSGL